MGQHKTKRNLNRQRARESLMHLRTVVDDAIKNIDDEVPDLGELTNHYTDVIVAVHDYGMAYAVAVEMKDE
jgi:hypothetical protein